MSPASDAQIWLLRKLFSERQVDTHTDIIWSRQVALHLDPNNPVFVSSWQANVLIDNFLKLPERNLSYVGRRRR